MILALPIPAEGVTVYEIAPEEQPVYDPETGEQTGTTTEYLRIPETQLLVHTDLEFKGQMRRIVTYHPTSKNVERVVNCPEFRAKNWLEFGDKYLKIYRKCRMIRTGEVDGEGNPVLECLDDYIKSGKDPELIKGGCMQGGGYLGMKEIEEGEGG